MTMLALTLINCGLIISALFIEDESILEWFEIVDKVFFSIYSLEVLFKVHPPAFSLS